MRNKDYSLSITHMHTAGFVSSIGSLTKAASLSHTTPMHLSVTVMYVYVYTHTYIHMRQALRRRFAVLYTYTHTYIHTHTGYGRMRRLSTQL